MIRQWRSSEDFCVSLFDGSRLLELLSADPASLNPSPCMSPPSLGLKVRARTPWRTTNERCRRRSPALESSFSPSLAYSSLPSSLSSSWTIMPFSRTVVILARTVGLSFPSPSPPAPSHSSSSIPPPYAHNIRTLIDAITHRRPHVLHPMGRHSPRSHAHPNLSPLRARHASRYRGVESAHTADGTSHSFAVSGSDCFVSGVHRRCRYEWERR